MPDTRSLKPTSYSLRSCFFPKPLSLAESSILQDWRSSMHIIGETNDGDSEYIEIAVDAECVDELIAAKLAFSVNLPCFVLPSWDKIGLDQAISEWLAEATSKIQDKGGRPLMTYYCCRAQESFGFAERQHFPIPLGPLKWAALYYDVKVSDSNTKAKFVRNLLFCGLLIDAEPPGLEFHTTTMMEILNWRVKAPPSDDRMEIHAVAILRYLFELATGVVDEDNSGDLVSTISFADNIRICRTFLNKPYSGISLTLGMARNIELCKEVIDLRSPVPSPDSVIHQPLDLLATIAAFVSNRGPDLQVHHEELFKEVQSLPMLLPPSTLGAISTWLMLLLNPSEAAELSKYIDKVHRISLFTDINEVQDTWSFLLWRAVNGLKRGEMEAWARSADGIKVFKGLQEAARSRRQAPELAGIILALASYCQLLPSAGSELCATGSAECSLMSGFDGFLRGQGNALGGFSVKSILPSLQSAMAQVILPKPLEFVQNIAKSLTIRSFEVDETMKEFFCARMHEYDHESASNMFIQDNNIRCSQE